MRKAQITLFIILGIIIVVISAFTFFAINTIVEGRKTIAKEVLFDRESINMYITNCIKNTGEASVILLGRQGRIYPDNYLTVENSKIAYLYDDGNKVPSKEDIEDELNIYMNNNLLGCLNNFKVLEKQGWKISYKEIKTDSSINENSVSFTINFPVTVSKNSDTIIIEDFYYSIDNFRLSYIHYIVNQIVNFQIQYPKAVDMTLLNNFDIDFTILPLNNVIIYIIKDSSSKIMDKDYIFRFANKY